MKKQKWAMLLTAEELSIASLFIKCEIPWNQAHPAYNGLAAWQVPNFIYREATFSIPMENKWKCPLYITGNFNLYRYININLYKLSLNKIPNYWQTSGINTSGAWFVEVIKLRVGGLGLSA